jgi:hypothetical protein
VLLTDRLDKALRAAEVLRLDTGDQAFEPDETRSDLERRFLRLCRRHGVPPPEVNVTVGRFEVDLLWRAADLIVELDGFRHHGTRSAFERDRARDVELRLLGYEVLRFTYRQVRDTPGEVAAALRALLERRGRMGR